MQVALPCRASFTPLPPRDPNDLFSIRRFRIREYSILSSLHEVGEDLPPGGAVTPNVAQQSIHDIAAGYDSYCSDDARLATPSFFSPAPYHIDFALAAIVSSLPGSENSFPNLDLCNMLPSHLWAGVIDGVFRGMERHIAAHALGMDSEFGNSEDQLSWVCKGLAVLYADVLPLGYRTTQFTARRDAVRASLLENFAFFYATLNAAILKTWGFSDTWKLIRKIIPSCTDKRAFANADPRLNQLSAAIQIYHTQSCTSHLECVHWNSPYDDMLLETFQNGAQAANELGIRWSPLGLDLLAEHPLVMQKVMHNVLRNPDQRLLDHRTHLLPTNREGVNHLLAATVHCSGAEAAHILLDDLAHHFGDAPEDHQVGGFISGKVLSLALLHHLWFYGALKAYCWSDISSGVKSDPRLCKSARHSKLPDLAFQRNDSRLVFSQSQELDAHRGSLYPAHLHRDKFRWGPIENVRNDGPAESAY